MLVDDLDNSDADETVTFALDGVTYEIDLNTKNSAKLRAALDPFVAAGRRLSSGRSRSAPTRAFMTEGRWPRFRANMTQ